MNEPLSSKQWVLEHLGESAKRSYLWAKENGHKNGDAYVLACQCEALAAQVVGLRARGALEPPGDPPCDHDSMTPCPPSCAEAKEQWRRKAAAYIARQQRAAPPPKATPCPRPFNGRPDDFSIRDCIAAGECGCDNASPHICLHPFKRLGIDADGAMWCTQCFKKPLIIPVPFGEPETKPSRPTVDELRDEIRAKKGIPPKYTEPVMPMLPNDKHPGHGCSCRECLRRYPETKTVFLGIDPAVPGSDRTVYSCIHDGMASTPCEVCHAHETSNALCSHERACTDEDPFKCELGNPCECECHGL